MKPREINREFEMKQREMKKKKKTNNLIIIYLNYINN